MGRIDTSCWKDFYIGGEDGLFQVVKGKRLTRADMKEGDINFVGSSAENNGITNKVGNTENIHKGNLITVSYNGSVGETFYQEAPFIASDDVNILYPRFELNKYIALFLCPIIRIVGKKYAFVDKWKKEDMEMSIIKLPVDSEGNPDWMYMEAYVKELEKNVHIKLVEYRKAREFKMIRQNVSAWKEFPITRFFELSLPKGDLQVKKVVDGDVPLITPRNSNNGLLQRISSESKSTLYEANSLTVDMFGNAYYQEENFFVTAHGHVNVLMPKINMNRYIGCFLATTIKNMFMNKYGFADMCTQKVLKKEVILLPVDYKDEPDWKYMEEYMKKMEELAKKKVNILVN